MRAYVKDPVGAHYGLRDWLLQRLTAVAMAVYTVIVLAWMLLAPPASRSDLRDMFSGGFFRVATLLFFGALLYHAWVGVRDVLMDYVKPLWLRLTLQFLVGAVLFGYLVWATSILWGR